MRWAFGERGGSRWGVALLAVAAAALLKLSIAPWVDRESPFLFFFAAVMVSAWYGGAGPGLLATLLAALVGDFLFVPPTFRFVALDRSKLVELTQFLVEGGVISLLGGALHRARWRAEAATGNERVAREESEAARAALDAAYERQYRIAETLQRSLLIKIAPGRFAGLDVAPFYEAALDEAQIGGDFYDAFPLPHGQVALVVGDVSGKGLGAAARTAETKFALRALLYEDAAPHRALSRVNRFLCDQQCESVPCEDVEEHDRFIALSLAVIEPMTGRTRICVAGIEPPLVVRAGGGAEAIEAATGMPLGVDTTAEYATEELRLEAGDALLLITDGIVEARAPGARGAFLDYSGFVRLARQSCIGAGSAQEMGARLLNATKRFAGGSLRDDACIMLAVRR